MFICLFSQLKVSAIADGEGLPQYKLYYFQMTQLNLEIVLIPEKMQINRHKKSRFYTTEAALFHIPIPQCSHCRAAPSTTLVRLPQCGHTINDCTTPYARRFGAVRYTIAVSGSI